MNISNSAFKKLWLGFSISFLLLLITDACVHEPMVNPVSPDTIVTSPPSPVPSPDCKQSSDVCFENTILPIFLSSCAKGGCHDAATKLEGYQLDSYAAIMKHGIVPGAANSSKLFRVLRKSEDVMPPPPALPLTRAQQDSIAKWINEGAKNTTKCNCSCDTTNYAFAADIKPVIDTYCVGCHSPSSKGGNIDLSTYALVKIQANNGKLMGSISQTLGYSPMPKGSKLSDCAVTKIKRWINSNTPNN